MPKIIGSKADNSWVIFMSQKELMSEKQIISLISLGSNFIRNKDSLEKYIPYICLRVADFNTLIDLDFFLKKNTSSDELLDFYTEILFTNFKLLTYQYQMPNSLEDIIRVGRSESLADTLFYFLYLFFLQVDKTLDQQQEAFLKDLGQKMRLSQSKIKSIKKEVDSLKDKKYRLVAKANLDQLFSEETLKDISQWVSTGTVLVPS